MREDEVVAIRAGWGSGKTSTLVFILLYLSKTRPGKAALLITDTSDRYRSVLAPEIEKWCVEEMSDGYKWRFHERNQCWTDPQTNFKVYVRAYYRPKTRSSTHNPLEGLNITSGVALIDECQTLTEEVAKKAVGRIRVGTPQLILVGLPVLGAWWVEMGEKAHCKPIYHGSKANKANLSKEWFGMARRTLGPAEYDAMINNNPQPLVGAVYGCFVAQEFPLGNLAPSNWKYKPEMRGRIAIDPGLNQPAVLFIAEDDELGADIIVGELAPREVGLVELTRRILTMAWPRSALGQMPDDDMQRWILDRGVIDKAARQRSDRTLTSTVQDLARPAGHGGIGLHLHTVTLGARTRISNGVAQLQRRFLHDGARRLLVCPEMWARGMQVDGHTLRRAIGSYKYPEGQTAGDPVKDGREHMLDALRYDTVAWHWVETRPPSKTESLKPRRSAPGSRKRWADRH